MNPRRTLTRGKRSNKDADVFSPQERVLLAGSGLPEEVLKKLKGVLDKSGLAGDTRLDVLEELITHFQDGLAAGKGLDELLEAFGDEQVLGTLIRRFKPKGLRTLNRPAWAVGQIGDILRDTLQALRGLKRSRGFTALAVLTLALGIGVNTAIFSVVNSVLLRPLPYPHFEELVVPFLVNPTENILHGPVGYADYLRWQGETEIFRSVGLYLDWNYNITTGAYPERVRGAVVSHRYFEVMGAPFVLGQGFSAEEHERGHGKAVILGQGFWERRFGADPGIMGRLVDLDGEAYEVVGVAPPEAEWPRGVDVWTPLTFGTAAAPPERILEQDYLGYSVIARLQPGITISRASRVVNQLARRAALARPDTRAGFGATVIPLRTQVVGAGAQRALWLLFGSVGVVLLIACANVANLTLERAQARQREISIRAALGAGRRRAVGPMALESLLVAILGGGLGIVVSAWGTRALANAAPPVLPGLQEVGVDLRLLIFGLGVTFATGLLFSLAPTATTGRLDLRRTLAEGGARGGRSRAGNLARRTISVVQLALSVVLVLGAGMTMKSTLILLRSDPGFREDGVLSMKVFLPHYPPGSEEDRQIPFLYQEFTRSLEALPGAVSAAAVSGLPLSAGGFFGLLPFRGEEPSGSGDEEKDVLANWNLIGTDFFKTMEIPLLDGRGFSQDDGPSAPQVAILSASLAQRLFPSQEAVGRRIWCTRGALGPNPFEVVGIVGDVRYESMRDAERSVVYLPQAQVYWRAMALVVRLEGDPHGREQEVRRAIWSVVPTAPITELRPMDEVVAESVAAPRFLALLMAVFAALALTLAAIGVYGVVSVSMRQRYHELGVRRALGAQARDIRFLLLGEGLKLAIVGVSVGLPVGMALTGLLSKLFFDVQANDPVIVLFTPLLLGAIGVAAAFVPSGKAARVDPIDIIRSD